MNSDREDLILMPSRGDSKVKMARHWSTLKHSCFSKQEKIDAVSICLVADKVTVIADKCELMFFGSGTLKPLRITRRERLKSAPYLRLKKRKRLFLKKKLKFFFRNFIEFFFRKTKKMDWVARRGPLARAPSALKEGHFRNCQHFCCSWRRNPLEKKQTFEKKSHNAEKLKGGTLWDF